MMSNLSLFSEQGREYSNQDSVLACKDGARTLIAIADGMGGKEAGDMASQIAIKTLRNEFEKTSNLDLSAIFRLVKDAISSYSSKQNIKQMGTTLTVCLIEGEKAYVAHVGDTRLYHLRNNGIISITKDQTEVQKLLDDGVLSKKRAVKYHRRNVLLSAMTNYTDYSLFQTEFFINKGDRLLLFSDGAYDLISKVEMRNLSINELDVSNLSMKIRSLIESRVIKDDYSLVACEITNT